MSTHTDNITTESDNDDLPHDEGERTIGQPTAECVRLCRMLQSLAIGQLASYEEIAQCVGCTVHDIKKTRRSIIYSARLILLRDERMWFDCVVNEGYKRLNDREKTLMWPREAAIIRKRAHKAEMIVTSADFTQLTPIETRNALTGLSVMGSVQLFTSARSQKKLGRAIEAADNKALCQSDVLKLFSDK